MPRERYTSSWGISICFREGTRAITGNTISGFREGIRLGSTGDQDLTNIEVSGNLITSNDVGVKVRSSAEGVTVNYNDILDNVMGVENLVAGILDATSNWWGTSVGAEIAAMVSGEVNYTPWLSHGAVTLTGTVTGQILTVLQVGDGTFTYDPLKTDPDLGYDLDEEVTLTAVPADGWEFVEWSGDASGTEPSVIIFMDSDKEVTATFTLIPIVSISVDPTTIALSGKMDGSYPEIAQVTVTNDGNVNIDVTATLIDDAVGFFDRCLMIDSSTRTYPSNVGTSVIPGADLTMWLGLELTGETTVGTYSATLVFWAEASP